jgi:hypothetical protein
VRGAAPGRFPFLTAVGFASALVGAVSALPPSKPLEQDGWILFLLWAAAFFGCKPLVHLIGRTGMAAGTGVLVGAAGLGALLNPPTQEQLRRLLVLELRPGAPRHPRDHTGASLPLAGQTAAVAGVRHVRG